MTKTFSVTIKETDYYNVYVKADTKEEAEEKWLEHAMHGDLSLISEEGFERDVATPICEVDPLTFNII